MTNARLTSGVMCFTGEIEGDRTSLVPWWSITKSILAAAVLKLAEAEKLNLDQLYADWPAPSTHLVV
jgi:D-alanyl-D-alanine carboxypeptidase